MDKLKFSPEKISKSEVSNLHIVLTKMKLPISKEEVKKKDIGPTTITAIKEIQKRYGIIEGGELDERTVNALNKEIFHTQYVLNKTRTEKLQTLLTRVGQTIAQEERSKRIAGDSTIRAIGNFQRENGFPVDGHVSEEMINKLHEEVIKKRLTVKTQINIIHKLLLRAIRIAKLNVVISPDEIKSKTIGPSTIEAIKAFQEKYKLPVTGELDKSTLDKLQSVAASRGVREKIFKAPAANELKTVKANLRLNMSSPKVAEMQKALTHLGYMINEQEFKAQTFGKTTRSAVLAFQKSWGLAETGHVEADTLKALNSKIMQVNPNAEEVELKYRLRGSVRDELWARKPNMVIKAYEKLLSGESAGPLITKKNLPNGFFDIIYDPPVDPVTKQAKAVFHLAVKLYEPVDTNPANDKLIASQIHYNVNMVHWVNFTLSDTAYQGNSDFVVTRDMLQKAIGTLKIEELQETENNKQVTQLSLQTGLSTDDIMRLILSHRAANSVNQLNPLTPEVFYAFIRQNLPPGLPGDLLIGASDWETIDQLTEIASSGIISVN